MGKKGKTNEAEFLLPDVIIQHIQSFLCRKGAARTAILSKSWYRAWLTLPVLDFDQCGVVTRENSDLDAENKFWNHVKKTVQRYEKLNLKIDSFRLQMHNACHNNEEHDVYSLANEVIRKAMKMGVIDLDFVVFKPKEEFVLSHEVLGCETLARLALSGCKIDLGGDGKISCSRLESLSIDDVILEACIIWDIILSCPLIEKLSLRRCTFLLETQSSNVPSGTRTSEVALSPKFAKRKPINSYEMPKLKYLVLDDVKVKTSFFHDFSTKFPFLKELSVRHCYGFKRIRISGPSLECINFTHHEKLRVKFDVPNIRKFTFSGSHSPSLSFKVGRFWESDICLLCSRRPTTAWFLDLNKFLTKLQWDGSKINLSLQIIPTTTFVRVGNLQVPSKPVVENLKIGEPSVLLETSDCPALLDILLRCYRPIFMPLSWLPEWSTGAKCNNDFVEMVYKILMQQVSQQSAPGPCNLKEVSVELFDEDVSVWRPITWDSLRDSSTTPELKQGIQPLHGESSLDASTSQEAEQRLQLLPGESLNDASISTYPPAEKRIRFHLRRGFV